MRIYCTGADGMLGTALTEAIAASPATAGWVVHGVSISDFDIADGDAVAESIDRFRPDVVIHTAAHAIVDDCETDPKLALRVNVQGLRNVVQGCLRHGSRLISLSSDYVFDGTDVPVDGYREADVPNPLSIYGLTKLAGERTAALVPDHLSIRTSWLFGGRDERTDNVLATVRRSTNGVRTPLVSDQYSAPTYTVDLAAAIIALISMPDPPTGTLHLANSGTASWYEVGTRIMELLGPHHSDLTPPEPMEFRHCAFVGGRPRNSTLNTERAAALGISLPSWQDALQRFCSRLQVTSSAGTPDSTLSR